MTRRTHISAVFGHALALALLFPLLLALATCNGGGGAGGDARTTTVGIATSFPTDTPSGASLVAASGTRAGGLLPLAASGAFADVQLVTVDVYRGNLSLAEAEVATPEVLRTVLVLSGPQWTGTIAGLPLGTTLTFVGRAFTSVTYDLLNEVFTGRTVVVLAGGDAIVLRMEAHLPTFSLPRILSVTVPGDVQVGQAVTVSAQVEGGPGETLNWGFQADSLGGGFALPGSGNLLDLSGGGATPTNTQGTVSDDYTAPASIGADPQVFTGNALVVTNAAGNATVTSTFPITVVTGIVDAGITTRFNPVALMVEGERSGGSVLWTVQVSDELDLDLAFEWAFQANAAPSPTPFASGTLTLAQTTGAVQGTQTGYDETVAGTVFLTLTDEGGAGGSTTVSFALPAGLFPDLLLATLFTFESGTLQGWNNTGGATDLWHVSDQDGIDPYDPAQPSLRGLRFGVPGGATVDDGVAGAKTGTVTSPLLATGNTPVLQFDYRNPNGCNLELASCTENRVWVEASYDGGATWPFAQELDQGPFSRWRHLSINLAAADPGFVSQPDLAVRLRYDSVTDTLGSGYIGGYLDNMVLDPNHVPELVALTVSPDQPYVESDAAYRLRAWGTFADGTMLEVSDRVDWSATGSIASVNIDGVKGRITTTAASTGTTGTITVTDPIGGVQGSATVNVQDMTVVNPETETQFQLAPNSTLGGQQFTYALALSGNRALIGANSGNAAYMMERDGAGVWGTPLPLSAPGIQGGDFFGSSVAMEGDWAVVAAPSRNPDGVSNAGSAFVFWRDPGNNTWISVQELTASDKAADDFLGSSGSNVAISGDTIVVGAYRKDDGVNGAFVGAAYVFRRGRDGVWREEAKLMAPEADRSALPNFGIGVAVEDDIVAVGANLADIGAFNNSGATYVFSRAIGGWNQNVVTLALGESSQMGASIDIDGGRLLSGALALYTPAAGGSTGGAVLYEQIAGIWTETERFHGEQLVEQAGYRVALSGNLALLGAAWWEAVYNVAPRSIGRGLLFRQTTGVWDVNNPISLQAGNGPVENDWLGRSGAIDGSLTILGALGRDNGAAFSVGAVYIFE